MNKIIRKIHLSIEKQGIDKIDYRKESTDVIVELINGDTYVASFFTYTYLELSKARHHKNGAFLGGKYFWAESMVIIDNCSAANIQKVIKHLFAEGDFQTVFKKI